MEVEEIVTPIRIEAHQAQAHQEELMRLHANGLLLFASEDVVGAVEHYRAASEQLDAQLQERLYDEHKRPRLVPEEAERQRARFDAQRDQHLAAFRKRLAYLVEVADEAEQESATSLAALSRPVLDTLTGADLERASHRREFVKEDCAALSLRDLVARIDQTIAGGNRADLALFQRYGVQRLDQERADPGHTPGSQSVALLVSALDRLDQKLTAPEELAKREKHTAKMQAAGLLRNAIQQAQQADPAVHADLSRRWGLR